MMSDDELRSRMAGLADTTAIDMVTLEQVEARSRRRALQQRSATVLVAFGLVVGGAIGGTVGALCLFAALCFCLQANKSKRPAQRPVSAARPVSTAQVPVVTGSAYPAPYPHVAMGLPVRDP